MYLPEPLKMPKQPEGYQSHIEALARAFIEGTTYFGPAANAAGLAAQREIFQMLTAQARQPKRKKPFSILEINSGTGASCIAWAEQIRELRLRGKVVCIDEAWTSEPDRKPSSTSDVFRLFMHNIRAAGVEHLVKPVVGDLTVALAKQPSGAFDLVFIAGNPISPLMQDDIAQAKRLVRNGGIICGIDSELRGSVASQPGSHPLQDAAKLTRGEAFANPTASDGVWAVRRLTKGWRQINLADAQNKPASRLRVKTGGRNIKLPLGNPDLPLIATRSGGYSPIVGTVSHKTSILLPSVFPVSFCKALENIRRCTHGAYEVIVVSPFMVSGPNIVWIQETESRGPAYAQARAAEAASGDFVVAFADDHRFVDGWDLMAARDLRELEIRSGVALCCIGLQFSNWNFFCTVFGKYYANFPFMRRLAIDRVSWIGEDYEKGFGDCDLSMRIWDAGGICEPSSRPLIAVHQDDKERPKPLYSEADLRRFVSRWAPKYGIGWRTTDLSDFNINIEREIGPNSSDDELNVSLQSLKSKVTELRSVIDAQAASIDELYTQINQMQQSPAADEETQLKTLEQKIIEYARRAADLEALRALDAKIGSVELEFHAQFRSVTERIDQLAELIESDARAHHDVEAAYRSAHERLEEQLSALGGTCAENFEAKLGSLQQQVQEHVTSFNERIDQLEERIASEVQGRQEIEAATHSAQEQLEGRLATLSGETRQQAETFETKLESLQQELQKHATSVDTFIETRTRQDVETGIRCGQEWLESQLANSGGDAQKQIEILSSQIETLQNAVHFYHDLQSQFESRISALATMLAEQSQSTDDRIAGLATLLEIGAASVDRQFAELNQSDISRPIK